ncbi:MAG TPA: hypothetical protein VIN40_07240 [Candidatus Tyrphobacter sp.]
MLTALLWMNLIGSPADRAFALPGEWSCEAADHASSGHATVTTHPGGLSMRYLYGAPGTVHETDADFTYDARAARWTLDEPASQLQRFRGAAGPWTEQLWEFDGVTFPPTPGDSMYDQVEKARVTFIAFGADAFEMVRAQEVGGQWVLHDPWYSAVTDDYCTRVRGL